MNYPSLYPSRNGSFFAGPDDDDEPEDGDESDGDESDQRQLEHETDELSV